MVTSRAARSAAVGRDKRMVWMADGTNERRRATEPALPTRANPASATSSAPAVRAMDLEHCTASWRGVFFNVWNGDCTESAADGIAQTFKALVEQHPGGIVILGVSRPGVAMVPRPEVREKLSAMLRGHNGGLRGVASAILGDGFGAAAKRTVMASIAMVARQPAPLRIFDARVPAAQWAAARLSDGDGSPTADEILSALAGLEARYDDYLRSRGRSPAA